MQARVPSVPSEALLGQIEDPEMRKQVARILRETRDGRGRKWFETYSPPARGSHQYPHGKGK